MADQDEWDPPNDFVVDAGLGVIHAQAKALAGLLEEALLHAFEIMSLDGCEALKEAVADLDKAASGDLDDELRAGLRKDGGDYGMLSNAANLSAACYSTLATLTALGTRGPVIAEAWKRKGNPK